VIPEPDQDRAGAAWTTSRSLRRSAPGSQGLQYSFAWSTPVEPDDLANPHLRRSGDVSLPHLSASGDGEWRYATRPWRPGHGDPDIDWTLIALEAAAGIWNSATS
jgi:hypothetical protein